VISAACLALLWLSGAEPPVRDESPDFLYLSGEAADFSPGGAGGAGGIVWTHGFPRRFTSEIGGYAYSVERTSWAFAHLGATMVASRRAVVHAEVNWGGGTQDDEDIEYRAFRGGLTYALVAGGVWADLESQYLRFGALEGNILKVGAIVAPRPSVNGRIAYHFSTGGNLGARYLAVRLDLQRRSTGFFAGLSAGRSRPDLFNFFTPPATSSTEVYLGIRVPAGRSEVTAYVDSVGMEGVRRNALAVVLKLRL
jgi:hypothetical protein